MKINHKKLLVAAVMFCFVLVSSNFAEAGIRDQFERFSGFGGLSSAFERLTNINKPGQAGQSDSLTSAFSKLSQIDKLSNSGLKSSFMKLGSVDPTMGRIVLKPSFERIAATTPDMKSALKSNFERMAKVDMGITGELRPSFAKLDSLSLAMQGELKPSFTRLASLDSPIMTGQLKPSFQRIASLSSGLAGELRPSFAKLGMFNPALSGQLFAKLTTIGPVFSGRLNPSFVKLGNLTSEVTVYLKPSFMKLASLSPAFSGSLNPAFSRLGTFSPKFMPKVDHLAKQPNKKSLHTFSMHKAPSLKALTLAAKPLNLHTVPPNVQFKGVKTRAPRKSVALEQFFGGPGSLYRLSLNPQELKNVSSEEAAKILQRDIHLIRPQAASLSAINLSYEATPQHVSLISLLGVEKVR